MHRNARGIWEIRVEILVEDASGRIALGSIMEKILGPSGNKHTYKMHPYKGIGRIPRDLRGTTDPQKRILLDQLPRLLRGYGRSLRDVPAAVVVVVDLDDKNCLAFKQEMLDVLNACDPQPRTLFRIAIEEGEAWLLGDHSAVTAAYPRARAGVLKAYAQDSICGTWETLADAVYPGGRQSLTQSGWPHVGDAKCEWARRIAPHLDIEVNQSRSFHVFCDGIRRLAGS